MNYSFGMTDQELIDYTNNAMEQAFKNLSKQCDNYWNLEENALTKAHRDMVVFGTGTVKIEYVSPSCGRSLVESLQDSIDLVKMESVYSPWIPCESILKHSKPEGITSGSALRAMENIIFPDTGLLMRRQDISKESLNDQYEIRMGVCNHTWKTYQGFTDTYDFCEKCDLKKG